MGINQEKKALEQKLEVARKQEQELEDEKSAPKNSKSENLKSDIGS